MFEPLHYLALLEQKIGALDQAAPLAGWKLPEAFAGLEARPPSPSPWPRAMPCGWAPSAMMRSSTWCYAVSSAAAPAGPGRPRRGAASYMPAGRSGAMTDTVAGPSPTLKLPTVEYDKIARQCAGDRRPRALFAPPGRAGIDRPPPNGRAADPTSEVPDAQEPASFDFKAIASLNKMLVLELARCAYIERRENVIALGNSAPARVISRSVLASPPARRGSRSGSQRRRPGSPARDRLLRFQRQLAKYRLLIIDLGFAVRRGRCSQRYERGSIMVTSNLPPEGSERLTGALLDRLTHHVHILEMNGESYRLNQSRSRQTAKTP